MSNSVLLFGEQNLKKYQEESTNVSRVSVSLLNIFPSILILFHSSILSKGLPVSSNSLILGNLIGNISKGTLWGFSFSSYTIGIGQPQYLCLEIPQSFNLKLIFFSAILFFSKYSIVLIIESSGLFNPFKNDELKIYPGPV